MNKKQHSIDELAAIYNVKYIDWESEYMRGSCSVRYCSAKKHNQVIIGEYLDSDPRSLDSCKFKIKLNRKESRAEITVWERDTDVDESLKKAFDSFDKLYLDCCHSDENRHSFDAINLFSLIRNVLDIDGGCDVSDCNYDLYFDPDKIFPGEKANEYWIDFTDLLAEDIDDHGYLGLIESILFHDDLNEKQDYLEESH